MPLAVAVLVHPERRGCLGVAFLPFEHVGFVGLADLRGDDLEDPSAQDPQGFGVVVRGVPDQRGLGLGA